MWKHPPGDEIYRKGSISVFEVDGKKNKVTNCADGSVLILEITAHMHSACQCLVLRGSRRWYSLILRGVPEFVLAFVAVLAILLFC